jgi:DNA-directed RNA polymerase subunit beta
MPFDGERLKGTKASSDDLIDADSRRRGCGRWPQDHCAHNQAVDLTERASTALKVTDEDLHGQYLAEDIVDAQSGEIYAEAGGEITSKLLEELVDRRLSRSDDPGHRSCQHRVRYIRNTLNARQERVP